MSVFVEKIDHEVFAAEIGIPASQIEVLHAKSKRHGVSKHSEGVAVRFRGTMLKRILTRNQKLLDIIHAQRLLCTEVFYFPYLLMVTDTKGVILHIAGDACSVANAEKLNNIGLGSSLALSSAGTNAVSAAIELSRPVCLKAEEHYLDMMKDWIALCVPIRDSAGKAVAFVAMSTFRNVPAPLLYPCIESIAFNIEYEYRKSEIPCELSIVEQILEERIQSFRLTSREKEIIKYWLLDYDCKQIGKALGISGNTVRVYITKINTKLKVNSKASLILRVLGAI